MKHLTMYDLYFRSGILNCGMGQALEICLWGGGGVGLWWLAVLTPMQLSECSFCYHTLLK